MVGVHDFEPIERETVAPLQHNGPALGPVTKGLFKGLRNRKRCLAAAEDEEPTPVIQLVDLPGDLDAACDRPDQVSDRLSAIGRVQTGFGDCKRQPPERRLPVRRKTFPVKPPDPASFAALPWFPE